MEQTEHEHVWLKVGIPGELHRELKAQAARDGVTLREHVVGLLRRPRSAADDWNKLPPSPPSGGVVEAKRSPSMTGTGRVPDFAALKPANTLHICEYAWDEKVGDEACTICGKRA